MATPDRQAQGAQNQSLFRDVNDRVAEFSPEQRGSLAVLCECADTACVEPIPMTREEYETVRRIPTHFPIHAHHVDAEIERVVEREDRFWVVEKFGESGKLAVELDRRRSHGDGPGS